MKPILLFLCGALLFLPALANAQQAHTASRPHSEIKAGNSQQENAIREAVFRYLVAARHWNKNNSKAFFLSIDPGSKDPDEALLKRFAGNQPSVKPISQTAPVQPNGAKDKKGGKPEILFWIGPIKWVTPAQAQVQASNWAGTKMVWNGNLRVVWEHNRWVVKGP